MPLRVNAVRRALFLVLMLGWCGCLPSSHSQLDEEKDPSFLAGKGRINAMDYPGALECFEKAIETNPHSALAHFEAALLYEKYKQDHAAAIYHFDRFLQLRPESGHAEIVRQHILACKQELAKGVSLGPVNQSLLGEFERLTQENKTLREQIQSLMTKGQVQMPSNSSGSAARPQQNTQFASTTPPVVTPAAVSWASNSNSVSRLNPSQLSRMHVVKSGETPSAIARRYGVKPESIMAANPRLDARHLQVGQTLNVPAQ